MQIDWNMPGLFNARNLAMASLASVLSRKFAKQVNPSISKEIIHFFGTSLPDFFGMCRSEEKAGNFA